MAERAPSTVPLDASERAVTALSDRGESATARVFAARRALGEGETLRDALVAHARRQSRLYFEPPPACGRDVRRLCRAASEQGHTVDPDAVLAAAVADSRATVLDRARAIRDASGLSPSERERRLSALLEAARASGFTVERADVFDGVSASGDTGGGRPAADGAGQGESESRPEREGSGSSSEHDGSESQSEREGSASDSDARTDTPSIEDAAAALTAIRAWEWGPRDDAAAEADPAATNEKAVARDGGTEEWNAGASDEAEIPSPETLSSWLVGAGRNRIEEWP